MSTRYGRAPQVLSRRTLGEVLVRLPHRPLVALPGTAAEVWQLLAPPRGLDEMVAVLAERYDADPAQVAADVRSVLDELVKAGLVVPSPGSSHSRLGG